MCIKFAIIIVSGITMSLTIVTSRGKPDVLIHNLQRRCFPCLMAMSKLVSPFGTPFSLLALLRVTVVGLKCQFASLHPTFTREDVLFVQMSFLLSFAISPIILSFSASLACTSRISVNLFSLVANNLMSSLRLEIVPLIRSKVLELSRCGCPCLGHFYALFDSNTYLCRVCFLILFHISD